MILAQREIAWRIRRLGFIEKRLVMGLIAGVVSSLTIILFYWLVVAVVKLASMVLDGDSVTTSDLSIIAVGARIPYLLLLVVPLGALLSGLLVYKLEPLAKGPGANITIKLYHYGLEMRKRTPLIKALASALLVGCGGSGGLQGPSLQIGAGVGSNISRFMGLNLIEHRIMVIAGMAGALSAIFRSPLGAALFAVEVLYRRDLEADALVSALVSSITSYSIAVHIMGYEWLLPPAHVPIPSLFGFTSILTYVLLGVSAAGFTLIYIRAYHGTRRLFEKLERKHRKPWLNPLIGSIPVAVLGLTAPYIVGSGSTTISIILQDASKGVLDLRVLGLGVELSLITLILFKIIATSFSIGSGGSGGLFAPSIFIGGLFGLLYGILIGTPFTGLPPHIYAYIGMASLFGAATNTPLATAFMVAEMGDNYTLIIPAIIGSLIANELIRYDTLYPAQILRRSHPHIANLETILETVQSRPELRRLRVKDFENPEYQSITLEHTLKEAVEVMREYRQRFIPVTDSEGKIIGVVDAETIRYAYKKKLGNAKLSMIQLKKDIVLLKPEEGLVKAIEEMIHNAKDYAIIVDENKHYRGVLLIEDLSTIISQYIIP